MISTSEDEELRELVEELQAVDVPEPAPDIHGRGRAVEPRTLTITKFAKHPDGYFHARVTAGGRTLYFTRQFGSWMAPGHVDGTPVLKEAEALLGPELGREVKFALAAKARPIINEERRRDAERKDRERRGVRETVRPGGVSGDADRGDPDVQVPDDGGEGEGADRQGEV